MEPEGVASESSWSSFDSAMATEESELLAQFLGSHNLSNEQEQEPSMLMQSLFWSDQGIDPNYGSQYINTNMCYWPMENSCNFSAFSCSNKQTTNYESFCNNMESSMMPTTGMRSEPMLLCMEEENISIASIKTNQKNHLDGKISKNDGEDIGEIRKSQGKRKIEACEGRADSMMIESSSKKKVGKSGGKSSKSKKADKTVEVGEEEEVGNASAAIVKTSSCYSSEDEADTSQELNGGDGTSTSTSPKGSTASLNSNGKMKAGRGSATDPQSLYARRRRERINERLKILQKLVPNGTKVDISTMLEEAVQYVKFLQVQIKLLSSDELWMYAPIAYNGLNIGVDLKMSLS